MRSFDAIPPSVSGITDTFRSISAAFGDLNNDGWLDLSIANYIDTLRIIWQTDPDSVIFAHVGSPNTIYINNENNTFSKFETQDLFGEKQE